MAVAVVHEMSDFPNNFRIRDVSSQAAPSGQSSERKAQAGSSSSADDTPKTESGDGKDSE